MNVGRAFTFMFDDPQWVSKMLIGAVIALLSVLVLPVFILMGYMIAVARNVMQGNERLPDWGDLMRYLTDGFFLWVATMVYTLPFWVLAGASFLPMFLSAGASEEAQAASMAISLLGLCLAFLFFLALFLITPALVVEYVADPRFGTLFQFGRVFGRVQRCFGPIVTVLLVTTVGMFLYGIVISIIGLIPCVGWLIVFLLTVYPYLVAGYLYGQVARTCPA